MSMEKRKRIKAGSGDSMRKPENQVRPNRGLSRVVLLGNNMKRLLRSESALNKFSQLTVYRLFGLFKVTVHEASTNQRQTRS